MKQPTTSQPGMPPPPASGHGSIDRATLELLAKCRTQDATTDPEQIRNAEQELADFKKTMNENRTLSGDSVLFP